MSTSKIIKNLKRRKPQNNDPKKECLIKELSLVAESYGFKVRREQLKQGLGWKVVSGRCRKGEEQIIFVDRKLPQSDQISFLIGRLVNMNEKPNEQTLSALSPEVRQLVDDAFSSVQKAASNA